MRQKLFGLAAMFLALIFCVSTCAAIDLSSQGYNHSIVAGPGNVTVISFDYDTGGNDTTVNFRRLKDDGGDGWMMPVDFTSTGIVVDSDYGPYSYSASLSGVHNYVFTLNSANGLWTLAIDGTEVDFVGTSSTTTPQPDGTAVTVGAVVADKYFSDETDITATNAEYLGWTADAGDGVGSAGAYKIKFPAASGSSVDNIVVTPTPLDGLVMYYDFQTVGATVADRSGNGNDATVVGDITGYMFGRSGAGSKFGGTSSDALDVSATALADRPSSAVTIAAWCKIDDTEDHQSIFNAFGPKPSDPGSNAYLYHMEIRTGSDQYRWCVRNSEGETIGNIQETVPAVITGEWMHFACTYDSAPADANNLKVFINGEYLTGMAAEAVSDLNIGTNWDSGAAIGYTADAQSRNYKGQMDEFYMFNRALTAAEISTLASASWLSNGGFETGDITGWTEWDASSEYGEWGEAGALDVNSTRDVEIAPGMVETLDAYQGDYSCYILGGNQYGIAQKLAIPAGTLVQVDAQWAGTFIVGGQGWAEIKALTHAQGASYNMNESPAEYTGEEIMVAKTDTYGPLNEKENQTWDWEDAPADSPIDGNQFVSRGEVVLATKFGGFSAGRGMVVDNIAMTPLYSVFTATAPSPTDGAFIVVESADDVNAVVLEWDGGFLATSHDIYLGTDFDDVNTATKTSPEFMGNQVATSYAPTLAGGTTYFWRIDETDGVDTWKGTIWTFEVGKIPVTDDPIVWYKFDEGTGTAIGDSSGNDFDGVMDYARWDKGPDGSNCYVNLNAWSRNFVDVPNDAFADINEMCTMSIWIWQEDPNGRSDGAQYTLFKGGNLTDPDRATVFSSGAVGNSSGWDPPESWQWFSVVTMGADDQYNHQGVSWDAANKNTNYTWAFYGRDYNANPIQKWKHLTFVKDNTDYDGNGSLKIYYNGVLEADQHYENCDKTMADVDKFQLGGNYSDGNWWARFVGKFDDFRIYDRPLNDVEVKQLVGNYFQKAAGPKPADEAEDVPLEGTVLSWAAGQDAVSHQVYFSDDRIEVKNADVNSPCYKGEQGGTTYDPGTLELMKTYYWRVDEIDDEGTVYKGDLWSFSSSPYIMIEDFESYDNDGNDVTVTWVDVDTSGAGDMQRFLAVEPDYPVLSPVNSLRLRYRLTAWGDLAYYAKTRKTFSSPQDWTEGGVKTLAVNYYGDEGNFGLPMFVTVGDGTTEASIYVDADTQSESWNEANVSLPEFTAAGVDLTNVTYMEIGFGDGTNQGSSSSQYDMIYVDDIALYPPKCVLSESSLTADITQDCVVNYDDLAYVTDGWLRGSSVDAITAAGPVGLWLFDDDTDLLKATVGSDLTTGSYPVTGNPVSAAAGITAGDGAIMVPINTYLEMTNPITPAPGETRVNEYTMVWEVNIPAASAYASLRWVALGEYDTVDLSSDVDISVIYAKGGVSYDDGLFGTHQGWSADLVVPDQWYQLAISVKNGLFYNCYVNGELAVSTPAQAVDGRYSIGDSFHLFKDNEDEDPDINCSTFALFDRALTAEEIQSLVPIQLLKGDLNDDVAIDFADYSILAGEWLVEDLWP